MLSENIKSVRKARGLSQEDLALRLHVVRQTVSKWENNLSVPDADLLLSLAEVLETPVSTLLGESLPETNADHLLMISEKLETLNLQISKRRMLSHKRKQTILILSGLGILFAFFFVILFQSDYLNWNYNDPETAIAATILHGLEWIFIRIAPVLLFIIGILFFQSRKQK